MSQFFFSIFHIYLLSHCLQYFTVPACLLHSIMFHNKIPLSLPCVSLGEPLQCRSHWNSVCSELSSLTSVCIHHICIWICIYDNLACVSLCIPLQWWRLSHWNSVWWKLWVCKKQAAALEEVLVCTWDPPAIPSHNNFQDKSHLWWAICICICISVCITMFLYLKVVCHPQPQQLLG